MKYGYRTLVPADALTEYSATSPKLKIKETVYQPDSQQPAVRVVLFIYHTNRNDLYAKHGYEHGWARRLDTFDDGCLRSISIVHVSIETYI